MAKKTTDLILVITYALDGIHGRCINQQAEFPESRKGNKDAEKHFIAQCAKHFPVWSAYIGEDIENILDNGYYEDGVHKVIITHQTKVGNIIDYEGI
jgi:hypothetical protein